MSRDYVCGIADRTILEFCMKWLSHRALVVPAVTFASLLAGVALAQNAPTTSTETAPGPPAAATPSGAPSLRPPPAAPTAAAPAPISTAPTTTPAAATPPAATTTTEPAKGPKKRKSENMIRQQEIDKSIDSGTVPARYRKSVPKEYQQYIPFAK
jgi:hypothetical protein